MIVWMDVQGEHGLYIPSGALWGGGDIRLAINM